GVWRWPARYLSRACLHGRQPRGLLRRGRDRARLAAAGWGCAARALREVAPGPLAVFSAGRPPAGERFVREPWALAQERASSVPGFQAPAPEGQDPRRS